MKLVILLWFECRFDGCANVRDWPPADKICDALQFKGDNAQAHARVSLFASRGNLSRQGVAGAKLLGPVENLLQTCVSDVVVAEIDGRAAHGLGDALSKGDHRWQRRRGKDKATAVYQASRYPSKLSGGVLGVSRFDSKAGGDQAVTPVYTAAALLRIVLLG